MSHRFASLRLLSSVVKRLQAAPGLWDAPLSDPLSPMVVAELTSWTECLSENAAVPIPTYETSECTRVISVDASGWGFAALYVDLLTGHTQIHQERWSAASGLRGIGSVLTEPAGVKRAIYRFVQPDSEGAVLIQTDHEPLAQTNPRGYSKTWSYNEVHQAMRHFKARFEMQHIAGSSHPMDSPSRGEPLTQDSQASLADKAKALIVTTTVVASRKTFGAPLAGARYSGISSAVGKSPPNVNT